MMYQLLPLCKCSDAGVHSRTTRGSVNTKSCEAGCRSLSCHQPQVLLLVLVSSSGHLAPHGKRLLTQCKAVGNRDIAFIYRQRDPDRPTRGPSLMPLSYIWCHMGVCQEFMVTYLSLKQWRTEGCGLGGSNPPPTSHSTAVSRTPD
jgi:hypothetical protein